MVGPGAPGKRKFLLAVKNWNSEESIHTWKFLKSHLLQARDGAWNDELVVVHIARNKEREAKERWDAGSAVIADLATSLQPFRHDVFDLEGDPGPLLVDIANREQADILVLATRGRNPMQKAMMGSMTDFLMQRVSCACLVVKPQVGAGDTYRMKSAAQPQATPQFGPVATMQPVRAHSPASSPMYGRGAASAVTTPFNRRVAIAYDTTTCGRFLLKWAADTILEPADNLFVVRAVPKVRQAATTSFADKNSVQRLAGDMLPNQAHVTTFNLQFNQQQGNSRKSVLSFVAKESVDLLIIGMYRPNTRRKGLALRGNAVLLANRCACSCLVVPMSESALLSCAEAADLALAAAEEEELVSGSESDTDEDEPGTPVAATGSPGPAGSTLAGTAAEGDAEGGVSTPDAAAAAGTSGGGGISGGGAAGSPDVHAAPLSLRGASGAAAKIRAPLEALFKRRGSGVGGLAAGERESGGGALPAGLEARRAALLASLQGGGGGGLPAGKYVVEVDASGAVKHIKVLAHAADKQHTATTLTPLAIPAPAVGAEGISLVTPASDGGAAPGAAAAAAAAGAAGAAGAAAPAAAGDGGTPGSHAGAAAAPARAPAEVVAAGAG